MKRLLVGYKAKDLFETAKHGKRRTASWLDGDTLCHCLDVYDRHAIEKTHHARAICSPHLPEGDWDEIRFKTGPKEMSGELSLSLLQEISILLGGDLSAPRFICDFRGKERDANALLRKIKDDPARIRDFSAVWEASVPGGKKIELTSLPGCFCHRRTDEGGLALAETIVRDLRENPPAASAPLSFLDMGCGCGLVGFLVASAAGNISPAMVDSHSRAIEAAEINSKNLGIPVEAILSDCGTPARLDGTFDVFAGNPPYYSDYRIADVFLETALRALKPGGTCWTVCKNADGLRPVQEKYFGSSETFRRRGYAVIKSVKR